MTRSAILLALLAAGCAANAPKTEEKKAATAQNVETTIQRFKEQDPSLDEWFETAAGYAVFPSVAKGGVGIGGAYGSGSVYQGGELVGYSGLTQGTIGFQLGGQAFSELIFFATNSAVEKFKTGNFELSAQVSAVAVTAGAAATTDYSGGIAVFIFSKGGLMYEATVGGQVFEFTPLDGTAAEPEPDADEATEEG